MKIAMHKGELETGYIVEVAAGHRYMKFNQDLVDCDGALALRLDSFMGDMTHKRDCYFNIVKVWGQNLGDVFNFDVTKRELVWELQTPLEILANNGDLFYHVSGTLGERDLTSPRDEKDIVTLWSEGLNYYLDNEKFEILKSNMLSMAKAMDYEFVLFSSIMEDEGDMKLVISVVNYKGVV